MSSDKSLSSESSPPSIDTSLESIHRSSSLEGLNLGTAPAAFSGPTSRVRRHSSSSSPPQSHPTKSSQPARSSAPLLQRMSNTFKLGVNNLPIIGTKGAPKKFKGKSSEVEILLRHMDRLYAKYNVTDDKDKVESITQYCSRSVRQFMEGLSSYITPNWTQFSKDLKKFYEADKDTRRYKVRDLENYIIESRSHGAFTSLASWMKYNRGFISIAGWLVQHQKITTKERAIYFWKGIPRAFRERLEVRLLGQDPNHDLNNPFDVSVVTKVAENILKRDRFDNDRLPSDDEDSDSEDSELDSDDSDSNSDDDEVTARHAKAKKRKSSIKKDRTKVTKRVKIKAPRASYESDSSSSEDEKPSKSSSGRSTPTS